VRWQLGEPELLRALVGLESSRTTVEDAVEEGCKHEYRQWGCSSGSQSVFEDP
jgi:hypothetical protein